MKTLPSHRASPTTRRMFRQRAKERWPMVLLTLVSIIQALALETLWSEIAEEGELAERRLRRRHGGPAGNGGAVVDRGGMAVLRASRDALRLGAGFARYDGAVRDRSHRVRSGRVHRRPVTTDSGSRCSQWLSSSHTSRCSPRSLVPPRNQRMRSTSRGYRAHPGAAMDLPSVRWRCCSCSLEWSS